MTGFFETDFSNYGREIKLTSELDNFRLVFHSNGRRHILRSYLPIPFGPCEGGFRTLPDLQHQYLHVLGHERRDLL